MELDYENQDFIKVEIKDKSNESFYPSIYKFYNLEGEMVAKGVVKETNKEVLLIETLKRVKELYYKGKKVTIPGNVKKVIPLEYNLTKMKFKNRKYGIFSNSLKDTLIEPKYKSINFVDVDKRSLFSSYDKERDTSDFFFGLDQNKKVFVFDYLGNKIDLGHDIIISNTIFNKIGVFQISDNLSFYTIHETPEIFHVFDKNWNYIAKEEKNKEDNYYLLALNSTPWNQIPIKTLRHFKEYIRNEEYFKVHGINGTENNIINSKLELVFDKNLQRLNVINENHFTVSEKWDDPRESNFIIRLSEY